MKYDRYLKEHGLWIGICAFLILTIDIFLMTIKGSTALMVYVSVTISLGLVIGTYADFRKCKRYFDELNGLLEEIDKKYIIAELLGKAESQEEKEVVNVLRKMEVSMTDNVANYRRRSEEYKEYIETWVHEVKVPIATANMIIQNHKEEPISQTEINQEIDRIAGYVEQALFYARSADVEKDYFIKPINISEVVGEAIVKRKRMLRSMKAGIDMHDMEIDTEIISDGKWISFIVGQVLDNSIKYAKDDEALKLEIYLTNDNGKTVLNIQDNGIGMKTSECERAFDKGFTGSNGRKGKASTGIGLYLCRKLCNRLEHDISIESREGIGTKVSIRF